MSKYIKAYTYKKIKKEAMAYGYKYPPYEKYIRKQLCYNRQAYNKKFKYVSKLMDEYTIIGTVDGIYVGEA